MSRTGAAAGKCILLGKITRPHGIRGEVKVHPYSGQPENFLRYREILVGGEDQEERISYTIEQSRVQGRRSGPPAGWLRQPRKGRGACRPGGLAAPR